MVGNVKVTGSDNSLNSLTSRQQKLIGDPGSEGGFISILSQSINANEIRNNEISSNTTAPVKENDYEPQEIKSVRVNEQETGETRHAILPREENSDKISRKDNEKKDTEVISGSRKSDEANPKLEIRKKSEDIKEIREEKKNLTESIPLMLGEALLKKISDALKSLQKGDVKEASDKMKSLLQNPDNRQRILKGIYDQGMKPNHTTDGKITKNQSETIQNIVRDIFESAAKEPGRNIQAKKRPDELVKTAERSQREETIAVLAGVRKEKTGKDRAVSQKNAAAEEVKGDRRQAGVHENLQLKNSSGDEKGNMDRGGSGGDRGQNRENGFMNAGRMESVNRTGGEKGQLIAKMPEFRQSLEDIMEKAKVTVKDNRNGSFAVKLFPKELGNVNVNLVLENGIVNGKFLVENNEAKNLLLENIESLKEQLLESGVSVGEFSVNVRDDRERFVRDENERKTFNPSLNLKETVAAVNVYDFNGAYSHDGSINMII